MKLNLISNAMKKLFLLIISTLILGFVSNAQWVQIGEDIDGDENDRFGYSVSLSDDGSIAAIGGTTNSDNADGSGVVRIYENVNGNWTQLGQDINGEAENDQFGNSVSLNSDGTTVAIGAWKSAGVNGIFSGHVRIYRYIDNIWSQVGQTIDGEGTLDESGTSVCLNSDGNIVAIGAPRNLSNGFSSGHVRVYQSEGGNWTQLGDDIDGEFQMVAMGYSVSLSSDGHTMATGALGTIGDVRIFHFDGIWTQLGENIEQEAVGDGAGLSISLSSDGSIIAIGAPGNDAAGSLSGHVRIYQNNDGVWTQLGEDIDGEAAGDGSGSSVSLNNEGNIVAIGAPNHGSSSQNSGQVRVFQNISDVWTQVGEDILGEASNDKSASAVSLSSDGSIVAIGAKFNDGNGGNAGHVRVFTYGVDGIAEINPSSINVHPNPTSGKIFIDLKKPIQNLTVNIYNAYGALKYSESLINTDSFEHILPDIKGVYFVQLIIEESDIRTIRVVKE